MGLAVASIAEKSRWNRGPHDKKCATRSAIRPYLVHRFRLTRDQVFVMSGQIWVSERQNDSCFFSCYWMCVRVCVCERAGYMVCDYITMKRQYTGRLGTKKHHKHSLFNLLSPHENTIYFPTTKSLGGKFP